MSVLKRIASRLSLRHQQELKRVHFARQIRAGTFITDEHEFGRLGEWVRPGDWVLDIGANVGHYACRLSQLVGPEGRVFAFEPMPATFELLVANAARFAFQNVTLLNFAASRAPGIVGMSVPRLDVGLDNYYMAKIASGADTTSVASIDVDALRLPRPVKLAKLDVEGHELEALQGMQQLLRDSRPVLIVEGTSPEVADFLAGFGYAFSYEAGSSNRVFTVKAAR